MSDEMTPDESHQHAILTPADLAELLAEAHAARDAIDNDEENPVAAPLLDAILGDALDLDGMISAQQHLINVLIERLDVYALAVLQLAAAADSLAEMGGGGSAAEKLATIGLRGALDEARRKPRHVGAFDAMKGKAPRAPSANEVLPPERRASWARTKTPHDT